MNTHVNDEKKIHDQLDAYQQMQHEHLHLLKSTSMPDLAKMTQERNEAFQSLKKRIDDFTDTAGSSGTDAIDILSGFEKKIQDILVLDNQVSKEIKKYKLVLSENLKRIRAGKTAINGYANSNTRLNKQPSVLSMNR